MIKDEILNLIELCLTVYLGAFHQWSLGSEVKTGKYDFVLKVCKNLQSFRRQRKNGKIMYKSGR